MEKFNYLLKQKNKAVAVFEDAAKKLENTIHTMFSEIEKSQAEHSRLESLKMMEEQAQRFLASEIDKGRATLEKIKNLLT